MTPEQREQITALATDLHLKCERVRMHEMLNVSGRTPDDLLQMTINYELAKTEAREARAKLDAAQKEIAHTPPFGM